MRIVRPANIQKNCNVALPSKTLSIPGLEVRIL